MTEPMALEAWLEQEEGFAWIPGACRSAAATDRERADRALRALDRSLQRILDRGADRGWVRHRQVHYLLLVQRVEGELRLLTLARSASWLEESASPSPQGTRPPSPPEPRPPVRRSAGYYGR